MGTTIIFIIYILVCNIIAEESNVTLSPAAKISVKNGILSKTIHFNVNLSITLTGDGAKLSIDPSSTNQWIQGDDLDKNSNQDEFGEFPSHPGWKLLDDNNVSCGTTYGERIIGGKSTTLGQHRWIARIGRSRYSIYLGHFIDWFCAGTLINKKYVLTAAHCMSYNNVSQIRLGEFDTEQDIDCKSNICAARPQDFGLKEVLVHPRHAKLISYPIHDIALIRMDGVADFNGWVVPICLPRIRVRDLYQGESEVIGWGYTIPATKSGPAILQSVFLPTISEETCKRVYYKNLGEGTFCAGGDLKKDSCNGDSGGPLQKIGKGFHGGQKYHVIGIVSFGPFYCGNGFPGGYTNVTSHLKWILDNLKP